MAARTGEGGVRRCKLSLRLVFRDSSRVAFHSEILVTVPDTEAAGLRMEGHASQGHPEQPGPTGFLAPCREGEFLFLVIQLWV